MSSRFLHSSGFWALTCVLLALTAFAADDGNNSNSIDPDHAAKRTKGLELFRTDVRDILKQQCLSCHAGDTIEGKLNLATHEGLLKGGDRGPAVVIGRGSKSLLTRLITHQQEPSMPKDASRLSSEHTAKIVEWIDLGAPYDQPLITQKSDPLEWTQRSIRDQDKQFWSYQPLKHTPPPRLPDDAQSLRTPVDNFIADKLIHEKLTANPTADRAVLIRRVYFDLIGLPPTIDEINAFVTDPAPDAYERIIDRLLASPHYGERWGRRWLDLVRFAESHGFEHDYDRASAFHYRDFVIQALNQGMPYDQFVRWQIAGDEFAPDDRQAMMATGYLAAGTHSTQITKNEVEKHRYDEMDDMLSTVGTSLLALTIGCARCHDHKFDAIPQGDYYRLLSTFTSTIRSEVELDFDPEGYLRDKAEFDRKHAPYEQAVLAYEANHLPAQFLKWHSQRNIEAEKVAWVIPAELAITSDSSAAFTIQPDSSWLVTGPNPATETWTATFTTHQTGLHALRIEALADPSLTRSGPGRAKDGNFTLSEISLVVSPINDTAQQRPIKFTSAASTFEQNGFPASGAIDDNPSTGWSVDPELGKGHSIVLTTAEPFGFEPGTRATVTLKFGLKNKGAVGRPRISVSQGVNLPATIGATRPEEVHRQLQQSFGQLTVGQQAVVLNWFKRDDAGWKSIDDQRAAHAETAPKPRIQKVLVATEGLPPVKLHTQAESEFLQETHYLRRGETNNKVAVAPQSFLQVLMADPKTPQLFQPAPPAGWRTSYQRTGLTNWLTDVDAGAGRLLARVIVNRLWQHHIGQGIVATPSDFGTRGEPPTHPELLDWLATELIRHDWELKPIHRLILTSHAYQQTSDADPAQLMVDRDNRLLAHRNRRRLEAEVIRDAILAVSQQLDDRLYGAGSLDEAHRRRSIYFTVKRSQLMPSMTVFDAPDGTTPVADRPQTTVTPQALLLMNHPQIREASAEFARRLLRQPHDSLANTIRSGYLAAIGRSPTDTELVDSLDFIQHQRAAYAGLPNEQQQLRALTDFCQVLFSLNEFIYVD